MKSEIQFAKMTGDGNDFLIIEEPVQISSRNKFVTKICDRHFGVGADGVVFLKKATSTQESTLAELVWDFYNSDGSQADMCGNAIRCVALFAKKKWSMNGPIRLQTTKGAVRAEVVKGLVGEPKISVYMKAVQIIQQNVKIYIEDFGEIQGDWIDAGVPHFVIENESAEMLSDKLCAKIRSHKKMTSVGANVSQYHWLKKNEKVVGLSFERGVEGFTLACGTGALAIAKSIFLKKRISKVEVVMPGGTLTVEERTEQHESEFILQGSASFICEGVLSENE